MGDQTLERLLRLLLRHKLTQSEITAQLQLSRSHVSALCKGLLEQGYLRREPLPEGGESGRGRSVLAVSDHGLLCAVVVHTLWEFSLSLYAFGSTQPLTVHLCRRCRRAEAMAQELRQALGQACAAAKVAPAQVRLLTVATQASVEQGFAGLLLRDNVLEDVNVPLASIISCACALPVFVCNFAYAHLLCLLHSPFIKIDCALVLLCGEGSVALGIFVDGTMVFGPKKTFLECSQLPYRHGFEKSLGSPGLYTADALAFAVKSLAPVFKLRRVIVSGSCFDDHPEFIRRAQQILRRSRSSLIRQICIEYWPGAVDNYRAELALTAFEELIPMLNLQPIRRSLPEILPPHWPK